MQQTYRCGKCENWQRKSQRKAPLSLVYVACTGRANFESNQYMHICVRQFQRNHVVECKMVGVVPQRMYLNTTYRLPRNRNSINTQDFKQVATN